MKKSINSENNKTLIEILKRERKLKGVNQEEFAKRLDKPQSFISKVETSQRVLDVIEFIKVLKKLEVNPIKVLEELLNNFIDED
ncbi:helix-turn-helix transcriptional regulator [bacterium]|nr:helix-turn-helix transcriptional regulator [bacterium]